MNISAKFITLLVIATFVHMEPLQDALAKELNPSANSSSNGNLCNEGCYQCTEFWGKECEVCYKRKLITTENGKTCSSELAPESEGCDLWYSNGGKNYCKKSSEGYACYAKYGYESCGRVPAKSGYPIEDCVEYHTASLYQVQCTTCKNSKVPNVDRSTYSCVEPKEGQRIPHCERYRWSPIVYNVYRCIKCESDYIVDAETKTCVPQKEGEEGCLYRGESLCYACDVENGYYAVSATKCQKF